MALGSIRWIWALAHLFCISVFLVQLFQLLPSYFAPSMTYTEVTNVQLKDMDFPLDFEICVKPLLNSTALGQFGYLSSYHYTVGGNPDNTLIGWGGHNNNDSGAVISAEEVLKAARMNVTKTLLSEVYVSTYSGNITGNLVYNMVTLDKINWLYECFTLNLSNVKGADLNGMEGMSVVFNRSDDIILKNNVSIELRVRGQALASQREIKEFRLYASGDDMRISVDDVKLDKFSTYIVKIKKNVFVEEDRTKNCRNYPNLDFHSYKDCDFQYMKNKVKEIAPGMNLNPPWLTNDLDNVTTKPVELTIASYSFVSFQLGRLFSGIATSDCPLPCTTISTEAKLTDKYEHVNPGFGLQFQQTVEVIKERGSNNVKLFQFYETFLALGDFDQDDDTNSQQLPVRSAK